MKVTSMQKKKKKNSTHASMNDAKVKVVTCDM